MKKLFTSLTRLLAQTWLWSLLVVIALALLIWFAGPLLAVADHRFWESATSRLLTICGLLLAWGLFLVASDRRNAAGSVNNGQDPLPPSRRAVDKEQATLRRLFKSAVQTLQRSGLYSGHSARWRKELKYLRLGSLAIALFGLNACSWVAVAAKEGAVAATGRYGLDSFTFEGSLPAEFGMDIMPSYDPVDPESSVCQRQNLYGEWSPRYYGTRDKVAIQAEPQSFKRKLPLTYSVGLCRMQLTSVDLDIKGRHGPQRWQQTYANGGFRIFKQLPAGAPGFDKDGVRAVAAECSWLFQQSQAKSRFGELEKLLTCEATGTHLQYDQLAGKTVKLAIEVNPEEKPSHGDTWIKFPNGWKPCAHESTGWRWCRKPPTFQTFKMNGETCTVYPGCTE